MSRFILVIFVVLVTLGVGCTKQVDGYNGIPWGTLQSTVSQNNPDFFVPSGDPKLLRQRITIEDLPALVTYDFSQEVGLYEVRVEFSDISKDRVAYIERVLTTKYGVSWEEDKERHMEAAYTNRGWDYGTCSTLKMNKSLPLVVFDEALASDQPTTSFFAKTPVLDVMLIYASGKCPKSSASL